MGNKKIPLSRARLSRKKGWVKRRRQMKLAMMQAIHDVENKSTDLQSSAELLPDKINSEINTTMIYCFQINEEQADNNEELIYDEIIELIEYCKNKKGLVSVHVDNNIEYIEISEHNKTIEYCEDNKDLVSVNIDNNVKQTERYNEGGAHNEIIEYCEDNKDLVSVNIDNNVKHTQGYNERGTRNKTIEYCEDNKDLVSINIDNNVKQSEGYNKGGGCNGIIEYSEDNKDLVSVNIDNNVKRTEGYKEGIHDQNIEYCIEKSIDNNCSENPFNIHEKIPTGRCIVDISFIWSEIHRVFNNHARGIECQFEYWKLVHYRRRGLLTQFFFKCQMCYYQASIWSEPIGSNTPDINATAVAASVATGMGFSQLRKLFASMDIVCMSDKTYRKHRENLNTVQKDATKNIIKK